MIQLGALAEARAQSTMTDEDWAAYQQAAAEEEVELVSVADNPQLAELARSMRTAAANAREAAAAS